MLPEKIKELVDNFVRRYGDLSGHEYLLALFAYYVLAEHRLGSPDPVPEQETEAPKE